MKIKFQEEKKKGLLLDSKKLLFVWHLLKEYEKRDKKKRIPKRDKKKRIPKRGKEYISPNSFFFFSDYKVIRDDEINYFLSQLVEDSLIKNLYIEIHRNDDEKDTIVHFETKHFTSELIKKKRLENPLYSIRSDLKYPRSFIFFYEIEINKVNMLKFISQYLEKWENDKLISMKKNVLKAKNQIEIVTKQIFELLEKHPPSMLLVDYSKKEDMDLLAVLLFLENRKYIEVHDIQFVSEKIFPFDEEEHKLSFRISVNEEFNNCFIKEGHHLYPQFDFNKLKNLKNSKYRDKKGDIITMSYDGKRKKLIIDDNEIDVSRSQHQCDLLKILFDEKPFDTDLDFVEIAEIIDHGNVENDIAQEKARRRYYQAANQLNNKIALQIGFKKIFKTKRRLIRFNPLYKFKVS